MLTPNFSVLLNCRSTDRRHPLPRTTGLACDVALLERAATFTVDVFIVFTNHTNDSGSEKEMESARDVWVDAWRGAKGEEQGRRSSRTLTIGMTRSCRN